VHVAPRGSSETLRLLLLATLAGTPAACAERPSVAARKAAVTGERCASDAECRSAFCDLEHCAEPEGAYGSSCRPAPLTSEGLRDAKIETCGAYICIGERCRSCVSDEQCRSELGAVRCQRSPGRPGARCGA
jgi:hypothetical protein